MSPDSSQRAQRLSIVVPAFNEHRGLVHVLADLSSELPGSEIIVVDDGSTDDTAGAAKAFPDVIVIRHPFNRGYGGALKTGMRHATREFVAWFDADHEHRAADLVIMLDRICLRDCVAVIAQRPLSGPSPMREWGKRVVRLLARTFVNIKKDINCGLRVFRRDVIVGYLPLLPNGYSASITSTMVLLERGYPLAFHSIAAHPRIGYSKVKIGDGFIAMMLVMRIVMLFGPLRVFLGSGLILIVAGSVYGLTLAFRHRLGIPTGAVVVVLTGMLLMVFGLIADQVSQLRLSLYDQSPFEVVQTPPGRPGTPYSAT